MLNIFRYTSFNLVRVPIPLTYCIFVLCFSLCTCPLLDFILCVTAGPFATSVRKTN